MMVLLQSSPSKPGHALTGGGGVSVSQALSKTFSVEEQLRTPVLRPAE